MGLSRTLKNAFVSGLILVAPLVVTVYVFRILIGWTFGFLNPVVEGTRLARYTGDVQVAAQLLALVLILATIVVLGYLAERSVGRHLFGSVGRVVNFLPLVNVVYSSVRQVANSLVESDSRYERTVLVEYPREGVYSVGLVTGEAPDSATDAADEQTYAVFTPNSPNPTAGRLVFVPESQVHETDMSVRRGLRWIVTTGFGNDENGSNGIGPTGDPRIVDDRRDVAGTPAGGDPGPNET